MHFQTLRLFRFRNLSEVELNLSRRLNFFVGQNGQGKTNLIEALCLLSSGESFRYGDNTEFIQKGFQEASLLAKIEKNNISHSLKTTLHSRLKNFYIDEKKVSSSVLKKFMSCVVFSPESLSAIKEGPDLRRQLIDEVLNTVLPEGPELTADFKKALRTRNKVLRDQSQGIVPEKETQGILEALDPVFLAAATKLSSARIAALQQLQPDFINAAQYILKSSSVDISVEYLISEQNFLGKSDFEIKEMLQKRMLQLRQAEISSGTSLVGPHKHDVIFLFNQNNSRFFCSQGQQRALILAFKMAQIVYHRKVRGYYPILMLDDVLSELDESKRQALIMFLHEINNQILITTTDVHLPEQFSLQETKVTQVQNGLILPE